MARVEGIKLNPVWIFTCGTATTPCDRNRFWRASRVTQTLIICDYFTGMQVTNLVAYPTHSNFAIVVDTSGSPVSILEG